MLNNLLTYDHETGVIRWAVARGRVKPGDRAGSVNKGDGYLYVKVRPNRYLAHRLAWFLYYGVWPAKSIDHINGDRTDNRICNLREASHAQNMRNSRTPRHNTSGVKGVHFDKFCSKWMAYLKVNGVFVNLGRYATREEAKDRVEAARSDLHGDFANNG